MHSRLRTLGVTPSDSPLDSEDRPYYIRRNRFRNRFRLRRGNCPNEGATEEEAR